MKRMMRAEMAGKVVDGGIRAISAAIFSAAALYGGYAPFTVGMVAAAGDGWRGLSALCGVIGGALLFLDFSHALRTIATCVLLFTANNAFYDLKAYQKSWFRAAMAMGLMVSVEFVYVLRAGVEEIAGCLICLLIAAAAAYSCEQVLNLETREKHPEAVLFVLLGFLMAVSSLETESGFAPGRILAMLTALLIAFERSRAQSIPAAVCIGLAVDLVGGKGQFLYTAAYAVSILSVCLSRRGDRVKAALWFTGGIILFALPLSAPCGILLIYEGLAATLCFLLIPTRFLRGKREAESKNDEEQARSTRLKYSAEALRGLYESIAHSHKGKEENPSVIYDRAAEKVCRDCSLCNSCWEEEYSKNHTALNDAMGMLLKNGTATGGDFPSFFVDRCIRFPRLLEAINAELNSYLLRRSYRLRIDAVQQQAAGQFAQMSEMIDSAANGARAVSAASTMIPYQIGIALRPKQGERISGDSASTFEIEDKLCIVLSDGMGSGEAAKKESAMAVRLLEQFLRAGIDAAPALKTLNSALSLRAEVTDSFTTIDLLVLSLHTGEAEIYKYGAAPSYLKKSGKVKRINCSCLPAGLQIKSSPEATRLHLEEGSYLVMMTDGVADAQEDEWVQNLLAGWEGENPQLVVSAILADSIEKKGKSDDAGIVVLYLPLSNGAQPQEI